MTSRARGFARAAAGLSTLALLVGGCADFSRGGPSPDAGGEGGGASDAASAGDGGGTGADAALTFAANVHGILTGACQRCHAVGEEAGDTTYLLTGDIATDYAVVLPFVDTGAPASSPLLTKMSGNGHGGGTLYAAGSPQYQTVLLWIQEGAPP